MCDSQPVKSWTFYDVRNAWGVPPEGKQARLQITPPLKLSPESISFRGRKDPVWMSLPLAIAVGLFLACLFLCGGAVVAHYYGSLAGWAFAIILITCCLGVLRLLARETTAKINPRAQRAIYDSERRVFCVQLPGNSWVSFALKGRRSGRLEELLENMKACYGERLTCGRVPPCTVAQWLKALLTLALLLAVIAGAGWWASWATGSELDIHALARSGDVESVSAILTDHPEKVNAKDTDGFTPIEHAAREGHSDVARLLIERGAELNAKGDSSGTLLHEAARAGHSEVVALLIDHGVEVSVKDSDGDTPLHSAVRAGRVDAVNVLIERGAEVDATGSREWTALHYAVQAGGLDKAARLDVVTLLLGRGADINAKTPGGLTALHWVCHRGVPGMAEPLIEAGAMVNERNDFGHTPLMLASGKGRVHDVEVLIRHGAEVNATDKSGRTALDVAKENVVEVLKKYDAKRGAELAENRE